MNNISDFWDFGKLSMHVFTWLQIGMVKCFALYSFLFKPPGRYLIDTAYDSQVLGVADCTSSPCCESVLRVCSVRDLFSNV